MIAMNNDYFIQQFESSAEKAWMPQLQEVKILGKFKPYNASSPLFSDSSLFNGGDSSEEELAAFRNKNRH